MARVFRPDDTSGLTEDEILEIMADEGLDEEAVREVDQQEEAQNNFRQKVETAFNEVRQERVAAEACFHELPTIEHMRQLWESKGVHPEDPVFLLVETMGLADARFRNAIHRLVKVGEKSELFQIALLEEMERHVNRVADVSESSNAVVESTKLAQEAMQELHKSNVELLEQLPNHYKTIHEAVKYLGELGRWQVLVNFLVPLVAILVGFVLGKLL
jgi:hypothetical protein